MNATDLAKARDQSAPPPDADSTAEQSMAGLLRPHVWSFAAIVILQVIGAIAGLAPLLAVVELGRTLLSHGPIDHGHVWIVVFAGAAGLFVRLVFTAASSGLGHLLDGQAQLSFRRQLAAAGARTDRLVLQAPDRRAGNGGGDDELLRPGGRYADFWNISMAPVASE
ncbi:hypothetical protein [Nonomuraea sp. CA-141351]|uniref:hypothetical protein n=1 Tax=Nonomuraea sp. CA-141351 TaxID=3239996 RepID=UPI003D8F3C4F